jgi:rhodanese-related sulfurtransferase
MRSLAEVKMKTTFLAIIAVVLLTACQTAPSKKIDATIYVNPGISEMTPREAEPAVAAAYSQFIDVRTAEEYKSSHASRARNIPLDELMQDLSRLEKNEPVYLICQTGNRSMQAAQMLNEAGFPQTVSIAGGTTAWQEAGLPMAK